MSDKDTKYMHAALEIAFSRMGRTSPNPSVGAVIVKNGKIISRGGTSAFGDDHAEVVAIKNAEEDLHGAEIYVSLEPCCCHDQKKTPPCADALIQAGITRVYIPVIDPNPVVSGKGIQQLQEAGIDVVVMDDMAHKANDLIRQFRKYIQRKKPFVIHKSAVTLDGSIATESGDSKWISNEYSRYIVHKLRAIVDAVIIGKNTLLADNPALNVRLDSFSEDVKEYFRNSDFSISGRDSFFLRMLLGSDAPDEAVSPLRVVIGLPEESIPGNILFDDNYLFFTEESKKDLLKNGIHNEMIEAERIVFIEGKSRKEQIEQILGELYNRGKMLVMLEGGGTVAGSFFEAGEIDQVCYFITPKLLGGGKSPLDGTGRVTIQDASALHDVSTVMLKEDVLYNAYAESIFEETT